MPSIRLERLTFAFADAAPILADVDLTLEPGLTAVVGENGAGKTTLLRLVAGELAPGSGRVRLTPERARVAVRKAIAAAVGRLGEVDPGLARLLRATVTTGGVCRYDPDPDRPVRWVLEAPTAVTRPSPSRRPA